MKRYIISFIVLFLFTSCKCEGTFQTIAGLNNLSNHTILVSHYRNGVVQPTIFLLDVNGSKEIGRTHGRSKGTIWPSPFLISDSVVVVFDNAKKVIHYGKTEGTSKNSITLLSPRSLFKEANYKKKTIIDDRCYLETEFVYTFTEQDYLNIK